MSDAVLRCVVDASVGIKILIDEPMSETARELFAYLALPNSQFYTPDLFFIECTNVLWKYIRRGGLLQEDAQVAVNRLCRLALRKVPTASLAPVALALATQSGLSAYDAAYAVLAQRVGAPLITADKALIRNLAATRIDVRWLGEL